MIEFYYKEDENIVYVNCKDDIYLEDILNVIDEISNAIVNVNIFIFCKTQENRL